MSPCRKDVAGRAACVKQAFPALVPWLPSGPETSSSLKQLEEPEYEERNTPLAALVSRRFLDLCGHLKADEGFTQVIETMAWGRGMKQSCDLYKMWMHTQKYSKATQSSSNLTAHQAHTRNRNLSSMASHLSYSRSYGMITSSAAEACLDTFFVLVSDTSWARWDASFFIREVCGEGIWTQWCNCPIVLLTCSH